MKNVRIVLVFILFQPYLWGQGKEKIYNPPSTSFISLSLQTYRDKLRFGAQDEYYIKTDGTYVKPQDSEYSSVDKRMSHNMASKHAFVELLKIRFKETMFNAMDRDLFTERKNNMYDKELKSYTAQQHMLSLANALCTKPVMKRFFCNEKEEDCSSLFQDDGYYNEPRNIKTWGGRGASEFQQLRAYTTFVNELFPKLQQWGNSLHPTNTIDGYFVAKANLGKYDFKDGGYWLDTNQFYHTGFLLRWRGLQPSNSSERKLMHPNGTSILYKMSPVEAETFSEKHQHLFLVLDVTTSLNGMENFRADQLKTTYILNSPIIEVYSDDGLTQKVGEINIETVLSKTR